MKDLLTELKTKSWWGFIEILKVSDVEAVKIAADWVVSVKRGQTLRNGVDPTLSWEEFSREMGACVMYRWSYEQDTQEKYSRCWGMVAINALPSEELNDLYGKLKPYFSEVGLQ